MKTQDDLDWYYRVRGKLPNGQYASIWHRNKARAVDTAEREGMTDLDVSEVNPAYFIHAIKQGWGLIDDNSG